MSCITCLIVIAFRKINIILQCTNPAGLLVLWWPWKNKYCFYFSCLSGADRLYCCSWKWWHWELCSALGSWVQCSSPKRTPDCVTGNLQSPVTKSQGWQDGAAQLWVYKPQMVPPQWQWPSGESGKRETCGHTPESLQSRPYSFVIRIPVSHPVLDIQDLDGSFLQIDLEFLRLSH